MRLLNCYSVVHNSVVLDSSNWSPEQAEKRAILRED